MLASNERAQPSAPHFAGANIYGSMKVALDYCGPPITPSELITQPALIAKTTPTVKRLAQFEATLPMGGPASACVSFFIKSGTVS